MVTAKEKLQKDNCPALLFISEIMQENYDHFIDLYQDTNYKYSQQSEIINWAMQSHPHLWGIAGMYNMNWIKAVSDNIEYSITGIVKGFLAKELINMEFHTDKVERLIYNLENNYRATNFKYNIDFYIQLISSGFEINFYIIWDTVALLSEEEFIYNSQIETSTINNLIVINLKKILEFWQPGKYIFKEHKIFKPTSVPVTDEELEVLLQMSDNQGILDMNIQFDKQNNKPKTLEVNRKIDWDNINNLHKKARELNFWEIKDIKVHRWNITSWKAVKKIRFDKK